MNPDTGRLYHDIGTVPLPERTNVVRVTRDQYRALQPMEVGQRKNYMRNQPCPCKSGKKFKRCCWAKYGKRASTESGT